MFRDSLDLYKFTEEALPDRALEIADPTIWLHKEPMDSTKGSRIQECLISIFRIGLSCSKQQPRERAPIRDVVVEMHAVRDAYLMFGNQPPREYEIERASANQTSRETLIKQAGRNNSETKIAKYIVSVKSCSQSYTTLCCVIVPVSVYMLFQLKADNVQQISPQIIITLKSRSLLQPSNAESLNSSDQYERLRILPAIVPTAHMKKKRKKHQRIRRVTLILEV